MTAIVARDGSCTVMGFTQTDLLEPGERDEMDVPTVRVVRLVALEPEGWSMVRGNRPPARRAVLLTLAGLEGHP